MKQSDPITDVVDVLRAYTSFVIVSHYNPDADAYGSSLGLYGALKALGKTVTVCNESGQLARYKAIPGLTNIQTEPVEAEVMLLCDCGAYSRIGDTFKTKLKSFKKTVNIDHHVSNEFFADINYVDTKASSTSEMIFDILKSAKIFISPDTANCLFAGILGDTGSFAYSCTSQKTFETAAELMACGAVPHELSKELFGNTPLSAIQLQSQALLDVTILYGNRYAEVVISEAMRKKYNAAMEDTDGLVEKLRDIEGVCVSATFREDGPLWRISLRSVSDSFNVSDVAATFGGGGHKSAAAFRSTKPLQAIQENLHAKIQELLK